MCNAAQGVCDGPRGHLCSQEHDAPVPQSDHALYADDVRWCCHSHFPSATGLLLRSHKASFPAHHPGRCMLSRHSHQPPASLCRGGAFSRNNVVHRYPCCSFFILSRSAVTPSTEMLETPSDHWRPNNASVWSVLPPGGKSID